MLREEAANEAQATGRRKGSRAPSRVFVSHRQCDRTLAEDLAAAIIAHGRFDVWLDVWDPALAAMESNTLPEHTRALLTALIIEMGLVNATAVVALMTLQSRGSAWIPYEFGRVKTGGPFAQMAAGCRLNLCPEGVPEYMLLGADISHDLVTRSYPGLTTWLDNL